MYPAFFLNNILYISYYTILQYTRRREPSNVLPTYRLGPKSTNLRASRPAQNPSVMLSRCGCFQLINYKGRKRYIVTAKPFSLVADRIGPAKTSNGQKGLCDGARFGCPAYSKRDFLRKYAPKQCTAPRLEQHS